MEPPRKVLNQQVIGTKYFNFVAGMHDMLERVIQHYMKFKSKEITFDGVVKGGHYFMIKLPNLKGEQEQILLKREDFDEAKFFEYVDVTEACMQCDKILHKVYDFIFHDEVMEEDDENDEKPEEADEKLASSMTNINP